MVILGIDPGLANTGWGIVEERRGEVRCRAYGCIETSSGSDLAARLRRIADELTAVVDRYRPQEAAVEGIYFGANVRSAIPTAHARGAALVACSLCGVEVGERNISVSEMIAESRSPAISFGISTLCS